MAQEREARRELLNTTEKDAQKVLASTEQRYQDEIKMLKDLLRESREAVKHAMGEQQRMAEKDAAIISDLLQQIATLKSQ